MTRALWSGVFLSAVVLWGAGCRKVVHCREGALRCLGGPCEEGACDFDLVCVSLPVTRDQICAKTRPDGGYDFGSGRDAGPAMPAPTCDCEAPALCALDTGDCVNYCEVPAALPGSQPVPEVIFCEHLEGEETLAFEEICTRRCRLSCQRWEQFCGYSCPEDYCDGAEIQSACAETCPPDDGDALLCLTRACNTVRDQVCADVVCPDTGRQANCQGVVCRNACGTPSSNWAGDGVCDDGDLLSAQYAGCAWGSDCIDCGPRMGDPPPLGRHGDQCAFNTGCAGYTRALVTNAAWCMALDEVAEGAARCVPDCSRDQPCPDGYACRMVYDGEGNEVVQDGLTGRACVPTVCR
jgi:hypothetical protein